MEEGANLEINLASQTSNSLPVLDITNEDIENVYICQSQEREIQKEVNHWVTARKMLQKEKGKKTSFRSKVITLPQLESPNAKLFAQLKLKDNDVVGVHCHGVSPSVQKEQGIFITYQKKIPIKKQVVSPKEFAEYLKKCGFPKDKVIDFHILACHSDKFAEKLQKELEREYPNLTVYGYKGELNLGQGTDLRPLAGLTKDMLEEPDGRGSRVDIQKVKKSGEENYFAYKHCACYGFKTKLAVKKIASEEEKPKEEEPSPKIKKKKTKETKEKPQKKKPQNARQRPRSASATVTPQFNLGKRKRVPPSRLTYEELGTYSDKRRNTF